MTNKTTKREVINMMLNEEVIALNSVYREYLEHELELLDKKSASRKPTKTQEDNERLKEIIMTIVDDKGMTITEIQKKNTELGELSNQKVSALVRLLADEGKVTKTKEGKTTLVKIA